MTYRYSSYCVKWELFYNGNIFQFVWNMKWLIWRTFYSNLNSIPTSFPYHCRMFPSRLESILGSNSHHSKWSVDSICQIISLPIRLNWNIPTVPVTGGNDSHSRMFWVFVRGRCPCYKQEIIFFLLFCPHAEINAVFC